MTALAISRLGLTSSEFRKLSLKVFIIALTDQQEREIMQIDLLMKAIWETTRLEMMTVINVNSGKKGGIKDPRKLFELPWDTEQADESTGIKTTSAELMKMMLLWEAGKAKRKADKKKQRRWSKQRDDITVHWQKYGKRQIK